MNFQFLFALDRANVLAPLHPEWKAKEPFASPLLKGDLKSVLAGGPRPTFWACNTCTAPATTRRPISLSLKRLGAGRRKPGIIAKIFAEHPQTPDRILRTQEEIARILPARDQYMVTTSEFDDVKARLARIENKRRLGGSNNLNKPSLHKAGGGAGDSSDSSGSYSPSSGDDRPTLHRRDEQH